MLEKLKKHSVKILVFTINILLAAIAVFVIREKDQARLLERAQTNKDNTESENAKKITPPSFESSVSVEEQEKKSETTDNEDQEDISTQDTPTDNSNVVPAAPSPSNPVPAVSVPAAPVPSVSTPAPVPIPKPSNAKTKTS